MIQAPAAASDAHADTAVETVARQVLGNCPHHLFQWPSLANDERWTSLDRQRAIYKNILKWAADHHVVPNTKYLSTFLRRYVRVIEEDGEELDEDLLTFHCDLMGRGASDSGDLPPDFTLKTYFMDSCVSDNYVTTMESANTISGGTTGLKTWPASLSMAEYLLIHPDLIRGKAVVELGSGVGVLGLVCARLGAARVTLTDVNASVLSVLEQNVDRFWKRTALSAAPIEIHSLDWFTVEDHEADALLGDVLLCADTVYDPDLLPGLAHCLHTFLRAAARCGRPLAVYMATAIRRESTFHDLNDRLRKVGFTYRIILDDCPPTRFFPDEAVTQIAVLEIVPVSDGKDVGAI
ncbi:hypothetical protein AMAG_06531 [Allomyces macrogynus ATCC 38327]|uniref:FAM86 N-terminal domain-containing protein n=1 Tax=Allomyces macrogynus (strain ATCC 38327) TaxID=578462 RepID=A0A0L0SH02_ALLM3|nr:hypothetical protein AMAG_06531 [Allomyces macrogynus ATCC 38327]|eukprot:KNE61729.1 hypothetical protein AMAG_06531 [Allomyces macrogynus ATCC 38327]